MKFNSSEELSLQVPLSAEYIARFDPNMRLPSLISAEFSFVCLSNQILPCVKWGGGMGQEANNSSYK